MGHRYHHCELAAMRRHEVAMVRLFSSGAMVRHFSAQERLAWDPLRYF